MPKTDRPGESQGSTGNRATRAQGLRRTEASRGTQARARPQNSRMGRAGGGEGRRRAGGGDGIAWKGRGRAGQGRREAEQGI